MAYINDGWMIMQHDDTAQFTLAIWSITPPQWCGRIAWMGGGVALLYALLFSSDAWIMSWWPAIAMFPWGMIAAVTEGAIDRDHR